MMIQAKPQMEPGDFPENPTSDIGGISMPTQFPPENLESVESDISSGNTIPTIVNTSDTAPSLPLEGVASGISAWQNNKRINSLWSINQNRNSWVGVGGVGWKKLANNSDSAIVALSMLSAHAREKGSPVNYREESDGMIHEMYVW